MPAQKQLCVLIVRGVMARVDMVIPKLLCSILKRSPVAPNQDLKDGHAGLQEFLVQVDAYSPKRQRWIPGSS